jgi:hypothetical protein
MDDPLGGKKQANRKVEATTTTSRTLARSEYAERSQPLWKQAMENCRRLLGSNQQRRTQRNPSKLRPV